MKVILFNGGIECGKDTIGNLLKEELQAAYQDVVVTGFKAALFDAVQLHFELDLLEWEEFMRRYNNRGWKETPWIRLNQLSPRQAMIHISENVYKPKYGAGAFGHMLVKGINDRLALGNVDYFICPDSGFIEELKPVCENFDVLFFSLRGRGSFEGDSRRLLLPEECFDAGVAMYQIVNLEDGRPIKGMLDVLSGIQEFNS